MSAYSTVSTIIELPFQGSMRGAEMASLFLIEALG